MGVAPCSWADWRSFQAAQVICTGTEQRIEGCARNAWGEHDCECTRHLCPALPLPCCCQLAFAHHERRVQAGRLPASDTTANHEASSTSRFIAACGRECAVLAHPDQSDPQGIPVSLCCPPTETGFAGTHASDVGIVCSNGELGSSWHPGSCSARVQAHRSACRGMAPCPGMPQLNQSLLTFQHIAAAIAVRSRGPQLCPSFVLTHDCVHVQTPHRHLPPTRWDLGLCRGMPASYGLPTFQELDLPQACQN